MLFCPLGLSYRGRATATRRHNDDSVELEVKAFTGHFGLLMPLNQEAKKRVKVLLGVTNFNYEVEIRLPLHSRSKEERMECRQSLGASLSIIMSCDQMSVENYSNPT